mmetsp:Transcript_34262/g.90386  ORF Transcript_34262/g.90386 Transcript_34262/m.90386 type:complete len:94 (+) Transcript_34262:98-379(+)
MLTRLVLYTTALLGAKALDSTYDSEVEHAFQSIRDSFPVPLVVDYATCSMSANEPCALDAMPDDETTVVYPGGGEAQGQSSPCQLTRARSSRG